MRGQIAEAQTWIQRHVPNYRPRTLALPHGVYPKDVAWAVEGEAKGMAYRHDAILMVAGGAAPSPFSRRFDPIRLPRIQAVERDLSYWITYFDQNPGERYVSDGDAATITIPAAQRDRLRTPLPSTSPHSRTLGFESARPRTARFRSHSQANVKLHRSNPQPAG